ncbi:hypothetical protein ALP66_100559 [Pseudomonas amygdali pv. photiniae]|uniref:Uncharacterized protein n=16 Tax=Pseudomonas syringae group TaxID=136849 RepID=A0A0P9VCX8_PSEA0|nr:Uncharacterized protein ALO90_05251 [Pseudomonas amygdali pv. aesculi]KPW36233.1 hypothetical protein ALO51_100450 [Pseudomonas amygdali]KPW71958.1 Uncharacterized protein ALO78_04787 [Pseudomonas amygdali pv. ciccaronei]KPX06721.1 hypothetical protein ALO73_100485 [Pseudomonas syringae pv. daphniphylli]KPX14583.1 hypothetical protein ALO71_100471 [Pseudomonas amygdali pv. dendropanacis]KPX37070.1 hypothetical protein ALO70_100470 [Pseudomonas amygdali pv. eriobotryae]KPY11118.1 hypothetic
MDVLTGVSMSVYEIVFSAELVAGAQPEKVRANLGKLFNADAERLELLFSGRRLVLKNNLDAATAEKYRATLERAGARVHVLEMNTPLPMEEVELAPPPDAPTWLRKSQATPQSGTGRLQIKPRDAYMAAFESVDAPDYSVAEAGVDLLPAKPQPAAPLLDLSRFSLAPVGSDMGHVERPESQAAPDTSHLKVIPE